MDDIFAACRDGNSKYIRDWLSSNENDPNAGDEHRFTPLHWAAWYGHVAICDLLLKRGVKVQAVNLGDDTPLHCAAQHNKREVVLLLLRHKADVHSLNQHGNTPLHYACFWNGEATAEELINRGACATLHNRYNQTPLDLCSVPLRKLLTTIAERNGQSMELIPFTDVENRFKTIKARSKDATLTRHVATRMSEVHLRKKLSSTQHSELWRGKWQAVEVVAKIFGTNNMDVKRMQRDFTTEYARLRIFAHNNVAPVLSNVNELVPIPRFVLLSEYFPLGTLYDVLHSRSDIEVDQPLSISLAVDVAKGMAFLHTLEPILERLYLNSKHILVDMDMSAKINMADVKFSFYKRNKIYNPQWMAPEALLKKPSEINIQRADMWSYSILLYEIATQRVPFENVGGNFAIGYKIACENLRVNLEAVNSSHLARLVKICGNEDPAKRPKFSQLIPILEKMQQ